MYLDNVRHYWCSQDDWIQTSGVTNLLLGPFPFHSLSPNFPLPSSSLRIELTLIQLGVWESCKLH